MGSATSPPSVAVAFSGGRDSTALLHATCRALRGTGVRVWALHVHHGLSAHADAWWAHCEAQCRRWARAGYPVQFHAARVSLSPAPGESIEALARAHRYRALTRMARDLGCGLVLLAHHREDQAETVVLQALRGAGVAGLAAMPRAAQREGVLWCRPWLDCPRDAIEAYVRRHRLRYVDDDSNVDPRWSRNRLRLQVWPALLAAFPQAAQALCDVAQQAQDALHCVDALADQDEAAVRVEGAALPALHLAAWQALGPERGRQVLRRWLHRQAGVPPTRTWIERLSRELPTCKVGRWVLPQGVLRLYRGAAVWSPLVPAQMAVAPPVGEVLLSVTEPGDYPVPAWRGTLRVVEARGQGLLPSRCAALILQARRGGERFQRMPGTPPRGLKKQFQDRAVPAWERGGPLVYAGGDLVCVPGLGVDARAWVEAGSLQWCLAWQPWPESQAPGG